MYLKKQKKTNKQTKKKKHSLCLNLYSHFEIVLSNRLKKHLEYRHWLTQTLSMKDF